MKNFILDTCICLSDARNLYGFGDNRVILTGTTLEEIDHRKKGSGEDAYQARETARILDMLREKGDLRKGVALENGGILQVVYDAFDPFNLPDGFNPYKNDNKIISSAISISRRHKSETVLISSDRIMRVAASCAGMPVQKYKNEQVDLSGYTGHTDIDVTKKMMDTIHDKGYVDIRKKDEKDLLENEFCTLHYGFQSALSVYQEGAFRLIGKQRLYNGFGPRGALQHYAAWALGNKNIPLVILTGPAGTAKTFLSLACGLDHVTLDRDMMTDADYYRILLSRPNSQTTDPGFGYLPGTLDEKMAPLLLPYIDNLEVLLAGTGKRKELRSQIQMQIDDLFDNGVLEICALSYIRGRSIKDSYLICDECQNATQTLVRDVVTRAASGSKIVLAGDPDQCDSPQLDAHNNGLIFALETMKGSKHTAIIRFTADNNQRSAISSDAIRRMKLM